MLQQLAADVLQYALSIVKPETGYNFLLQLIRFLCTDVDKICPVLSV